MMEQYENYYPKDWKGWMCGEKIAALVGHAKGRSGAGGQSLNRAPPRQIVLQPVSSCLGEHFGYTQIIGNTFPLIIDLNSRSMLISFFLVKSTYMKYADPCSILC